MKEILSDYNKGTHIEDICKKHNVSMHYVIKLVHSSNVKGWNYK